MLFHVLAICWNQETAIGKKEEVLAFVRSMGGKVPGLLEVHVGPNSTKRPTEFETVVLMLFASLHDFEEFSKHALHQEFVETYGALLRVSVFDLNTAA